MLLWEFRTQTDIYSFVTSFSRLKALMDRWTLWYRVNEGNDKYPMVERKCQRGWKCFQNYIATQNKSSYNIEKSTLV